jgi:hypothetical protein
MHLECTKIVTGTTAGVNSNEKSVEKRIHLHEVLVKKEGECYYSGM